MFYQDIDTLSPAHFQRFTGLKRPTFDTMLDILRPAYALKHARGGRTPKLCVEDQLLMTLTYLREYRTQFHIAMDYGVSEASCSKSIRWVEDTLMQSGQFTLPKRPEWQGEMTEIEVVLIDATEVACERPKKSRNTTTRARKRDTP
jgi:hypothetical protein